METSRGIRTTIKRLWMRSVMLSCAEWQLMAQVSAAALIGAMCPPPPPPAWCHLGCNPPPGRGVEFLLADLESETDRRGRCFHGNGSAGPGLWLWGTLCCDAYCRVCSRWELGSVSDLTRSAPEPTLNISAWRRISCPGWRRCGR